MQIEELHVLDVDRDLLGHDAREMGPEPDIPGVIPDGPNLLAHMATIKGHILCNRFLWHCDGKAE